MMRIKIFYSWCTRNNSTILLFPSVLPNYNLYYTGIVNSLAEMFFMSVSEKQGSEHHLFYFTLFSFWFTVHSNIKLLKFYWKFNWNPVEASLHWQNLRHKKGKRGKKNRLSIFWFVTDSNPWALWHLLIMGNTVSEGQKETVVQTSTEVNF